MSQIICTCNLFMFFAVLLSVHISEMIEFDTTINLFQLKVPITFNVQKLQKCSLDLRLFHDSDIYLTSEFSSTFN